MACAGDKQRRGYAAPAAVAPRRPPGSAGLAGGRCAAGEGRRRPGSFALQAGSPEPGEAEAASSPGPPPGLRGAFCSGGRRPLSGRETEAEALAQGARARGHRPLAAGAGQGPRVTLYPEFRSAWGGEADQSAPGLKQRRRAARPAVCLVSRAAPRALRAAESGARPPPAFRAPAPAWAARIGRRRRRRRPEPAGPPERLATAELRPRRAAPGTRALQPHVAAPGRAWRAPGRRAGGPRGARARAATCSSPDDICKESANGQSGVYFETANNDFSRVKRQCLRTHALLGFEQRLRQMVRSPRCAHDRAQPGFAARNPCRGPPAPAPPPASQKQS